MVQFLFKISNLSNSTSKLSKFQNSPTIFKPNSQIPNPNPCCYYMLDTRMFYVSD
ncbi:hypothetical protein KFK09_006964 [Dendrobium nobile]|uniref:Uncharacterized protein n=1 Tax=Dendrobium nobile TaxID=94219 RepID=A0A8T3BQK5_DENNO|nr:hypothetical protein KFK09_006964 [Dendrobium nobile]